MPADLLCKSGIYIPPTQSLILAYCRDAIVFSRRWSHQNLQPGPHLVEDTSHLSVYSAHVVQKILAVRVEPISIWEGGTSHITHYR